MSVTDWSTTPNENQFLRTIDLREGKTPIADVNDGFRVMMAEIREFANTVPTATDYVLRNGGTFASRPTMTGGGGFWSWASAALPGGKVFLQATGGSVPSGMAAGDILLEY